MSDYYIGSVSKQREINNNEHLLMSWDLGYQLLRFDLNGIESVPQACQNSYAECFGVFMSKLSQAGWNCAL